LRIQSVSKTFDDALRVLDVLDVNVRKAVRKFERDKISPLYISEYSTPYR
jgi:hypothetical protein